MSFRLRLLPVAVLVAGALAPTVSEAGNGLHPRTPVDWNAETCFDYVDKSADPIYPVEYDIPFEDVDVTEDEVLDSRRHQFFGICKQFHSQIFLPNWITWADVDSAIMKNLIDMSAVEDDHVFETNPDWDGCWFRVNADDERRPITNAMAADPVPWDTTDVPVGSYVLWGYTYEPAFNLWTQNQGTFMKVIDGGAPEDIGPGGAITTREQTPYKGETITLDGCVNALDGTTMTGYFATTAGASNPGWTPSWVPFLEDEPVAGESFSVDFLAPEEVAGETIMMRIDFTDPMDRTYEAHMKENVIVLKGMNEDCEDEGGDFIGGADCGDEDSDSDSASTTDGTTNGVGETDPGGSEETAAAESGETTSPETDPGETKTCACTTPGSRSPFGLALMFLGVAALRRRRA